VGRNARETALELAEVPSLIRDHKRLLDFHMTKATDSLQELLSSASITLLLLKKRLYFVQAINAEIKKYVDPQTEQVHVKNFFLYELIRDCFSMLVIDLRSYSLHLTQTGGVIGQLGNHLNRLKPWNEDRIEVRGPMVMTTNGDFLSQEEIREIQEESKLRRRKQLSTATATAFAALFPEVDPTKLNCKSLLLIKNHISTSCARIRDDRNVHRAHRFEKDSREKAIDVPPLSLSEIEQAFKTIESVLSNLWMLADLSSYSFDIDLGADNHHTAVDLVDQMMQGSIGEVVQAVGIADALERHGADKKWYWQYREEAALGTSTAQS
jgi:hypothetical protein